MAEKKTKRKSSWASTSAAIILLKVNLLTMVICSLLFALSLWAVASPSSLSVAIQSFGGNRMTALLPPESLSIQSGVGTAVVVIFLFIIAFMGFYGAITRSQFLLFMYSTLVLLLLMLECALIYYFTSTVIEKGLQVEDGQWTHYTRLAFRCCDFNTSIYLEAVKPPWSCCGTMYYPDNCTIPDMYSKNCKPAISSWLDRYGSVFYASLVVFHIILSSCSLLRRARSSSRSHS